MADGRGRIGVRSAIAMFLLATALAAGCSEAVNRSPRDERDNRREGPGGREQPLALTPKQELAIGRRAYAEAMQEVGDDVMPASDRDVVRVRRVMARLAKAAEIEPLQREINLRVRGFVFEWEVNVVRSKQVNAFCLPAGKLFLYTGILKVMGNNDDFLATVVSHEMAHALAHHASERIARERGGGSVLRKLSYNRMQEAEADHIGIFLMAFAGYNPDAASVFWERMRQSSGGSGGPEWLSDHPSNESRIRTMREWAPAARAAKKALDEGRVLPSKR